MENGVIVAIVSGFFGLLSTVLSIWATVTAHNVRREMQVKLLEPRVEAYRKLWALTVNASPSLTKDFTKEEREELEKQLRDWYYDSGNGIFLSKESRKLLVEAKGLLLRGGSAADIREKLSQLRSQMKNDVGVYGREDVAAPSNI